MVYNPYFMAFMMLEIFSTDSISPWKRSVTPISSLSVIGNSYEAPACHILSNSEKMPQMLLSMSGICLIRSQIYLSKSIMAVIRATIVSHMYTIPAPIDTSQLPIQSAIYWYHAPILSARYCIPVPTHRIPSHIAVPTYLVALLMVFPTYEIPFHIAVPM